MTEHTLYLPCGCTVRMMPTSQRHWLPAADGIDHCPLHAAAAAMLEALEALPLDAFADGPQDAADFKDNAWAFLRAMDLARTVIAKTKRPQP